jgi:hypothetical protein
MKKIFIGVVLGATITFSGTTFANLMLQDIQVARNTINLEVNGEKIHEDNFIYEGRTYVQLRAIGEMLGKDVGWNGETRTASIKEKVIITPTITVTPTPTSVKVNHIEPTEKNINKHLSNFSKLDTDIGKTDFTFTVIHNESNFMEHDYSIGVNYDSTFFYDLKYSNKYTEEQTSKVKQQLKAHQESIARSLISNMPNIKFKGSYSHTWYKYPSIKEGFQSRNYYSWQNYDDADLYCDFDKVYSSTKVSTFRWCPALDDEL